MKNYGYGTSFNMKFQFLFTIRSIYITDRMLKGHILLILIRQLDRYKFRQKIIIKTKEKQGVIAES